MNVLIVGGGGREHALAWKIAQSPLVRRLVCAPGNPGMARLGETQPIAPTDVAALRALAGEVAADLVVIGPETAIEAGLADALREDGVACFGPDAAAGRLETSKAFARRFADRHGLPSARYEVFDAPGPAKAFLERLAAPFVIKADGLAAGKGVVVAETRDAAAAAIEAALDGRFGTAGSRVVIEEFLEGEIASLFALCDGRTSLLFGGAQDAKRAFDGDRGPNTGGMGAYAPAPVLSQDVAESARIRLIEPAFAGMAAEGSPYRGALFCEMMVGLDGPRLVEFNVRFGDPECQVLMLRLASDLVPYLVAAASGDLASLPPPLWRAQAAVCVVLAARGYPDNPEAGSIIRGAEADFADDVVVFHAGTRRAPDGALVAAGGRVLNVCALGADVGEARARAYEAIGRIDWPEGFWRTDIGWRALGPAATVS